MKRPSERSRRSFGLAAAVLLLVAACGSAAPTPSPSPTPSPTPTPKPTPGPAAATLTISGDPAVAGDLEPIDVRCNYPSVDGSTIVLSWHSKDRNQAIRVVVAAELVTVQYTSGSGKTYAERDFQGTGVAGFHAGNGAGIDSPLDPVLTALEEGTLGPIVAIRGSIDCGNQKAGSSTLTLSGVTATGKLSGLFLQPVRVECNATPNAESVEIVGAADVGTNPTLFVFHATVNGFSLSQQPKTGPAVVYLNKQLTSVKLAPLSASINGDAVEALPSRSKLKPHKLTILGDVVCGTVVTG